MIGWWLFRSGREPSLTLGFTVEQRAGAFVRMTTRNEGESVTKRRAIDDRMRARFIDCDCDDDTKIENQDQRSINSIVSGDLSLLLLNCFSFAVPTDCTSVSQHFESLDSFAKSTALNCMAADLESLREIQVLSVFLSYFSQFHEFRFHDSLAAFS
jgi:hypothetical protein